MGRPKLLELWREGDEVKYIRGRLRYEIIEVCHKRQVARITQPRPWSHYDTPTISRSKDKSKGVLIPI